MGMYTELYLAVELNKDMPEDIINWINDSELRNDVPSRISNFGFSSSYYFDGIACKKFTYDEISNSYYLTTRFDLKNYDSEIQKLLSILEPYITSSGHIGHIRYEEDDYPTMIFLNDNKIKYIKFTKDREC